MTKTNAQQDLPFRRPDANGNKEITMIDHARIPVKQQAVRLNPFEVMWRKFRRLMTQKGNPELNA
ncbi:hypothetical protein LRB91_15170 [Leclercia adecarboxylata]|uniref:hypothetical protein n=1 Tax=Leclercia adecarboxylata TaxID=83655 RepID=UPI0022B79188|nr:hypothetical protein [Leclercia adecarboxylata]MCZ7840152.1 hypothetical protein [Leclercia adecarboxylata]